MPLWNMTHVPVKTADFPIKIQKLPYGNLAVVQRSQSVLHTFVIKRPPRHSGIRHQTIDINRMIIHCCPDTGFIRAAVSHVLKRSDRDFPALLFRFSTGGINRVETRSTAGRVGYGIPD